jgi:addiction module HigA family antidote
MPVKTQTPSSVLIQLMDEYQLNAFSLSKAINLDYQIVRRIISSQTKITAPAALKLGKFFGNESDFWMNLQSKADLETALNDKELMSEVKAISKAKQPVSKPKKKKKSARKESISDKRKKAGKVPGAKPASRQVVGKKGKKRKITN